MAPPLRRGPFRRWLEQCDPDAVVGYTWAGDDCPLARYLGPGWVVDGTEAEYEGIDGTLGGRRPAKRTLPVWAVRFVFDVDDRDGDSLIKYAPVRAKTALWLLEGVEESLAADRAAEGEGDDDGDPETTRRMGDEG